jgi:hypothetical protein
MQAILLGIERLRLLDRATRGAFYAALGVCKDRDLEPHLFATDPTDGAADVIELVLLGRTKEGANAFRELWRIAAAEDVEAYRVALEAKLQDVRERGRALLDRVNAGLAALERGEDPEPFADDPSGKSS